LKHCQTTLAARSVTPLDVTIYCVNVAATKSEAITAAASLVDVYQALLNKPNINGQLKTMYQSVIDDLKKPQTMELLKRAAEAQRTEIWIDGKNHYIRRVKSALPLVPSDKNEKMKGKQLTVESTLNINRINEKIAVEKPSETITLDEAEALILGKTLESARDDGRNSLQQSNVRSYMLALEVYYNENGAYPETLSQTNTFFDSSKVPDDVFTHQPYIYKKNGEDYELRYQLKLTAATSDSSGEYFVNGENIATSKGLIAGNPKPNPLPAQNFDLDTDGDGLTNDQEVDYGTDPKNPDSDGDGFKDGEEVKNGYNPYGPGKLPIIDLYEVEAPVSTT